MYGNISYLLLINGGQTLGSPRLWKEALPGSGRLSLLRTLQETDMPILLCPGICSVPVRFLLPPGLDLCFPGDCLSVIVTPCIHPRAFTF